MIEFKKFQEKSIQELVLITSQLLNRSEKNSICVFQSPTGSGKTLMTGQFIKDLIRENAAVDLCFLWVSIGKGELHVQSKEKLESFFAGAPTCSLVEQEFTGQRSEIEKNEVVFVNWEKLRNKDRQSGKWSNALMKDGEQVSFPEVLHHTRKKRKLVMIIDESHYGTSTERAHELKEIIDADVLLHVSATPSYIPNGLEISQKKAGYVFVNPMDVIEEGLIKKEVIINENLDRLATDEPELTSLEAVIKAAVHKRTELKRSYEMENSAVNPLILVQIPNSDQGDEQLAAVTSILKEYGLEEKNDKLAIWVSGYKSDILHARNIAEQDHPVECLIFKQAIDTGWDCPRAQILVKLREVRSETFEIQTVGRILRMPEQRHYLSQENLNRPIFIQTLKVSSLKRKTIIPI